MPEAPQPQDVSFRADWDGTTQKYVVLPPPGGAPPSTALVALHGHGSDRWQFVRQSRDECRAVREVARRRGLLLVAPDYRATTSWMSPAAEADLQQILRTLIRQRGVRKIVVSGGSMGGTGALTFAARHPYLVDGAVALNGTANLVEYRNFSAAIAAAYGGSRTEVPEVYRSRSAELFPDRFRMPLAATTGGRDASVPPDSVLRLLAAVAPRNPHVLKIHRPEGGHSTTREDTRRALEFVLDRLPRHAKRVVVIGDSTVASYPNPPADRPDLTGWGQVLAESFGPSVEVVNLAKSGRSSKSFLREGLWEQALAKRPDYVLIQFGHNDSPGKGDRSTDPATDFRENLSTYVAGARERGALPILVTPMTRRNFRDGRIATALGPYAEAMRAVGKERQVPVIDLHEASVAMFNRLGDAGSAELSASPSDRTHFSRRGARAMAALIVERLPAAAPELARHLRPEMP